MKRPEQTGTLSRGMRLGKLGLSLTGSYLSYQAQNLFLGEAERGERRRRLQHKAAQRVKNELGELKGAAMKLGQILSQQSHALSDDALHELGELQMQAPGMHPSLACARFKACIGKSPDEVFAEFEPRPFAAASLGQVHRAVLESGKKVAVKIQYPAIREAIENDFKLLRTATLAGRVTGYVPIELLEEIQRGLVEETDYVHEGQNLDFYRKGLSHLKFLEVPDVDWNITKGQVLTMSFVEGDSLARFLARKPPQSVRDRIGERLVENYYTQLHRLRSLQADQHPGNFLFGDDGRIGLIDFGCVKRINFDVSDLIRCCIGRSWRKGDASAKHVLGMVFGKQTPYSRARRMLNQLEHMAGCLFPEGPLAESIVDFGTQKFLDNMTASLRIAVREKLANPEFAFISRAELGLFSLLHRLKARTSPRQIWARVESCA